MSYIDELRNGRDVAQAAYLEFALHTKRGLNGLFLFFEGKDIPYYLPRIQAYYNGDFHPIRCKGKEKVIAVYDLINNHREYDVYKKAFFIDRDFNVPLPADKLIFETPCYSIENLYVSVDVVKKILKSEFQISEVTDTFKALSELYLNRQIEFHEAVTLFNSWYACLIEIKEKTGNKTGAPLEEKLPKGFIKITLQNVTKHYDLNTIKQLYQNALEISDEQMNEKLTKFKNCIHHLTYRGKYEIEFLLKILKLIIDDSSSEQKIVKETIKFSFSSGVTNDQAISIFSSYAETPDSLIAYIKKVVE